MATRGSPEDDEKPRSVLIVEDDPHIGRLLATVLDDGGYRCAQARDTREADALLAQRPFDALVCDINLPGESGLDFVPRIRRGRPDLAILMVTAVDDPSTAATALEAGADGYVTKPFRPADIVIGVLNALRHRSTTQAHAVERARLEQATMHDPVTELPLRRSVPKLLADVLQGARPSGADVWVLVMDLDRFSIVNAALGAKAGDALLREVAARLQKAVHADGAVARLGPDEFLVAGMQPHRVSPGPTVADRVLAAFDEPFRVGDRGISMTASIGVAVVLAGAGQPETILRQAEIASRRAKETGGNRVCHFEPALQERWTKRLSAEMELRRAIERKEFRLHYQPVVDLQRGHLKGLEALLRWEHPERGIVGPARFIPVAEETGLIVDLGGWVIEEACRQIAVWSRALGPERVPTVAVNVSPRQLDHPGFSCAMQDYLGRFGVQPGRLAFEITESQLVDGTVSADALRDAHALGIPLLLDDFGTGYSSLGHLKRFPVGALKVDRVFVAGLPGDASNLALIHAILAMAGSLGIDVIAEGLETREQAHLLRSIECGAGQGYLLGRPMPAAAATRLLEEDGDWLEILAPDPSAEPTSPVYEHDRVTGRLQAAQEAEKSRERGDAAGRLLRPAEAATVLGVSLSTLRRWSDTGQIPMVRTAGGHRRFQAEDVRIFKQHARSDPPAIHAVRPPAHPLPDLAELLTEHGDELSRACARRLYGGTSAGWFASDVARRLVAEWLAALAAGCRTGDYDEALSAVRGLMQHAYIHGASLLERHRCIDTFRDIVVAELGREGAARTELVGVRRLFAALGQSILEE